MTPRLWPTFAACLAAGLLFVGATYHLTRGFEHWTFESLREQDAALGRLGAPATPVRTASGQTLSLWGTSAGRHDVTLVDFIYTTCPSVCQALGAEYTQMQAQILAMPPGAPRPRLLSLSFDLAHDGRAQLAAYARQHHADTRTWTVAAPATQDALDTLLDRLRVVVVPDGFGGYVHNGSIVLVDGGGTVRGLYDLAQWTQALAAARRVANEAP
jgi:protein SCO1/2